MSLKKIKSYAKVNLALNVIGKYKKLHKIESLVAFIDLFDLIFIKKIKSDKHRISFNGKFSKSINLSNTISKLFEILEKKKLLKQKFYVKVTKNIPQKAGLGGGSMNAANILNFLIKNKFVHLNKKQIIDVSSCVGSDVILGLKSLNTVLTSTNKIKRFNNCKRLHTLVVKPSFGCSTKYIYSRIKKFDKSSFNKPNKKMFDFSYLKEMNNSLEQVAFSKYPSLKKVKSFLRNNENPLFVRMTGSGSAIVSYYYTKKQCERAYKKFIKNYKNHWCHTSKTI